LTRPSCTKLELSRCWAPRLLLRPLPNTPPLNPASATKVHSLFDAPIGVLARIGALIPIPSHPLPSHPNHPIRPRHGDHWRLPHPLVRCRAESCRARHRPNQMEAETNRRCEPRSDHMQPSQKPAPSPPNPPPPRSSLLGRRRPPPSSAHPRIPSCLRWVSRCHVVKRYPMSRDPSIRRRPPGYSRYPAFH
jgi:hypothetical protein